MTLLAIYYTIADLILLAQCFYYRGFILADSPPPPPDKNSSSATVSAIDDYEEDDPDEDAPLLNRADSPARYYVTPASAERMQRRGSAGSGFREALKAVDGTHLSPATPLLPPERTPDPTPNAGDGRAPSSTFRTVAFNTTALLVVCAAGAFGWWLSARSPLSSNQHPRSSFKPLADENGGLDLDTWGQVFGYLCAVLYLGSRIPQILLNYKRKSTEGVSMLFFLFACVGNLTYVLSIFAYEPPCARVGRLGVLGNVVCGDGEWRAEYGRWVLVNLSWLIGSAGTLLLDMGIGVQFWAYRGREAVERR